MAVLKKRKNSRLKAVYYRSFFLLIVVPLLLIIVVALAILRSMMLSSANDKIALAQNNVVSMLTNDINSASLKLSHFLNSNDQQALEIAAATIEGTGEEKHALIIQLKELYNFAVTPSSDVIAIHFYFANGDIQYLKDGLAVPLSSLRTQSFYKDALADPGQTHIGSVPSTITFMDKNAGGERMALAVSFAPRKNDATKGLEMVCMYIYTHVNVTINEYSKEKAQGKMCLLDGEGNVLIPPERGTTDYFVPWQLHTAQEGSYQYTVDGQKLEYTVSHIQGTNWRLVSAVDNDTLLEEFNRVAGLILIASVVLFSLFFCFSIIFLQNIVAPVGTLISGMQRVELGDLETHLEPSGEKEMQMLTHSFNQMISTTKRLVDTNEEQLRAKHQAEMQALQSQINPHFLVNTLGNIRFMAIVAKYDGIKNMAEALMKILSASFRKSASLYTIGEEIEMLESYVYIMRIRYAENFEVEYDVDDACRGCLVPRLILQPIVENCIVHGFEDNVDMGYIKIKAERTNEAVSITVADDGKGMSAEKALALISEKPEPERDNSSIGVSNVQKRIQLNFGAEYGLRIESTVGVGTTVEILIPAKETEAP